jgi:uncharacterized protein
MKSEQNSGKIFKILAIDGGGIKGLFSAVILSEFERANDTITKHFDMLCGTSTGGLIALALAAGKSPSEIVRFYLDWGPRIFPERNFAMRYLKKKGALLANSRNTDKALREAVVEIVGDKRMQDSNSYLCIPSLSIINSAPYVFKTDHDETLKRDAEVFMRDAALATAAAPFYFPIATADGRPGGEFVDGGLWANNPSLVGLIEACRFFVGPGKQYDRLKLLSISTLSPTVGRPSGKRKKLRLVSAGKIFKATLESQQRATELAVKFLIPSLNFPVDYLRLPSPALSPEHSVLIELDNAHKDCLDALQYYGGVVAHEWYTKPEIQAFFAEPAEPPTFRRVTSST